MDHSRETSRGIESAELCLQWRQHHDTLVSVLDSLWERQELVDVTLTTNGKSIQVHRIILCACSQYFQELLTQRQFADKHAVVFLKDVDFADLEALVQYMYKGEVCITEDQLSSFLHTAKSLGIRGMTNPSDDSHATGSSRKRRKVSGSTDEPEVIPEVQNVDLPQPPPLKHMASLTKAKEMPLPATSEPEAEPEVEPEAPPTRWPEAVEEAEENEQTFNQDTEEPGNWSRDSHELQTGSGNSNDELSPAGQDWAGGSSVDNTVLYSLLLQNCGTREEVESTEEEEDYPENAQEFPENPQEFPENHQEFPENHQEFPENHQEFPENPQEFPENPQEDLGESSDQEIPSNEHLDQVAAQAIIPNRRGASKKDSTSKRPLYSCNRCGRIYSKKHSVLRHLRYECGVEPQFQCSICSHRFKHRSDLQRHERKIHGVEPTVYDEEQIAENF